MTEDTLDNSNKKYGVTNIHLILRIVCSSSRNVTWRLKKTKAVVKEAVKEL